MEILTNDVTIITNEGATPNTPVIKSNCRTLDVTVLLDNKSCNSELRDAPPSAAGASAANECAGNKNKNIIAT
jgi:hypothetical protein